MRLEVGCFPVLKGAAVGLFLTSIVAVLTFVAQGLAALYVIGSYLVVERKKRPRRQTAETTSV